MNSLKNTELHVAAHRLYTEENIQKENGSIWYFFYKWLFDINDELKKRVVYMYKKKSIPSYADSIPRRVTSANIYAVIDQKHAINIFLWIVDQKHLINI